VTFSGLHANAKPAFDAGMRMRSLLSPNAQLSSNSRSLAAGDGFVAYAGERVDGRAYIQPAFNLGAGAVAFDTDSFDHTAGEKEFPVVGLKALAGVFAAGFYDNPSAKMSVIAITGTNGKTSCSQWVAQGLATTSNRSAVVGTLGAGLIDSEGRAELQEFGLTTPDAVMMQRLLASFYDQSTKYVAVEASSIGVVQSRLAGTNIDVAVFTNLSRDHLDFHGSMQAYEQAKAELFAWPSLRYAVVNLNDEASQAMLARLIQTGSTAKTIGYGIESSTQTISATLGVEERLVASNLAFEDAGVSFELVSSWGSAEIHLQLHGLFNVSNALAVLATWLAIGMPFDVAVQKLQRLNSVPGRLQRVHVEAVSRKKDTPLVFVDYAHTPDALEKTLVALRGITQRRQGRLWCVFGAGGDRDKGKRPLMAKAAEQFADVVVVTSDNPRTETPAAIMADIEAGFSTKVLPRVHKIEDRKASIVFAVKMANAADVLLVAGKGHENYQEVLGIKTPFSDYAIASESLIARTLQ
jgi:UDP-N-acetylmuramoyl-L-alanyl-D-glutamate--2,6-diaminopimelate ligase